MKKLLVILASIILLASSVYAYDDFTCYGFDNLSDEVIEQNTAYKPNGVIDDYKPKVDLAAGTMHYDNTKVQEVYCEIKGGNAASHERFEAMAGIPSKENLHINTGYRSMYAIADMSVHQVEKFVDKEFSVGQIYLHCPVKTTKDTCKATVKLTGDISGTWIVNSEASFNTAKEAIKNLITNDINAHRVVCPGGVTIDPGPPPEVCSGAQLSETGSTTVYISGCCFEDGTKHGITYITGASGDCDCGEADERKYTVTITINHVFNGWISDQKPNERGYYKNWQNAIENNTVSKNTNNLKEEGSKSSWSSGEESDRRNHFYDATLRLNETWLMNTSGPMWTASFKETPKVSVAEQAKIKLGTDRNKFNYSFSDGDIIGQLIAFEYTRYSDDIGRFVLPQCINDGWSEITHGLGSNIGQRAQNYYLNTELTVVENLDNSGVNFGVNWYDGNNMWVENLLEGHAENFYLHDFYLNSELSKNNFESLKNNIRDWEDFINDFQREAFASQGDTFGTVIAFMSDACAAKSMFWNSVIWDTNICWHMIGLQSEEPEKLLNIDDIRYKDFSINPGNNDINIKVPSYILYNDAAHKMTKEDATRFYFMMNRDERGYEMFGYSGNYSLDERELGLEYPSKINGIWPASLCNLCYFNLETNLYGDVHDYDTTLKDSTITCDWWPNTIHSPSAKYLSDDMPTIYETYIDTNDLDKYKKSNIVTIKHDTQNGQYNPIDKIVVEYCAPYKNGYTFQPVPGIDTLHSKYINAIAEGSWWDDIYAGDNPGCNDIVVLNPSSVQFCKIISNPHYMDQRIDDRLVYRGGDSNQTQYLVKEEDMSATYTVYDGNTTNILEQYTTHNVEYQDDDGNRYRKYIDPTSDAFKNDKETTDASAYITLEDRQTQPNIGFVNISKEFELVFSDQFNLMRNQYNQDYNTIIDTFCEKDYTYYIDDYGNKTYSRDLLGIPSCSSVPGYGWGMENADGYGKMYASMWPSYDRFEEGTHNYVKQRMFLTPFDMTLMNPEGQYYTYKANKIVNLNNVYQWESTNEDQYYVDLSNVEIGDNKFKYTGQAHQEMIDDGTSNDEKGKRGHKDRLIYGLCLLSNNEQANTTSYFASFANNYPLDEIAQDYFREADFNNNKENQARNYYYHPCISKIYRYIDVVGMIGNLTLNDTGDFRFSNVFKEVADDNSYYVDGIVPRVNPTKPKSVMQMLYNILDDSNKIFPAGNTVGTQEHKEHFNDVSTLPITAEKNNIEALKSEQLRPGYAQFWDIETMGNYNGLNSNYEHLTNRLSIKPNYYLYNYDTNEVEELNVYYLDNGIYHKGNMYNYSIYDDNFGSTIIQDQQSLIDRSNVTQQEINISSDVANNTNLKTTMYTNIIDDVEGTTNLVVLDMNNRDYIGTEYLRNKDTIGINKDTIYNIGFNDGSDLNHIYSGDFMSHNQKYYSTLTLPTSAIFVRVKDDVGGANYDATTGIDYEAAAQSVKNVDGCILQTLEIQTYGEYWSLQYQSRGTANNEDIWLTKDKKLEYDRRRLKGELVAVLDNKFTAADDINITGLY